MQHLRNKRILLGVTGGIAAYKSAELIRLLRKSGSDVRVVMTKSACEFITPLTLQALSQKPVHMDLLDNKAEAAMGHIELARWADAVLIAPASANTIAKLAVGQADDLLTSLVLATSAPMYLAPAMNQGMWLDETTQQNIATLRERGVVMLGPADGEQACGEIGPGRMIEPEHMVLQLSDDFAQGLMSGVEVMITAGPTREAIDPVRFVSNHSSGKMAFALAAAAQELGASVSLVSGPVALETPDRVVRHDVVTAREMHQAVLDRIDSTDIFIGCAAVCDFRPLKSQPEKIKKNPEDPSETLEITLVKNPDIIASVAGRENRPFVVGFAAETENVLGYAADKLRRKKLDLIVANDVSDGDIGFSSDNNEVTLLGDDLEEPMPKASKHVLARRILEIIALKYNQQKQTEADSEGS